MLTALFILVIACILAGLAIFLVSLPFLIIFSIVFALLGLFFHYWWVWIILIVVWILFRKEQD
ncbi:hypothetical protein EDX97_10815 [Absicoccus porci]|uniref:Uncharacterized protein n=1 Tax=Absicoccus porci TaxID=2486576 RepID=A0A3N0HWQ7_9FIRM|nr:hypothetical protein EDX97_10815 [Absicoccus porci]